MGRHGGRRDFAGDQSLGDSRGAQGGARWGARPGTAVQGPPLGPTSAPAVSPQLVLSEQHPAARRIWGVHGLAGPGDPGGSPGVSACPGVVPVCPSRRTRQERRHGRAAGKGLCACAKGGAENAPRVGRGTGTEIGGRGRRGSPHGDSDRDTQGVRDRDTWTRGHTDTGIGTWGCGGTRTRGRGLQGHGGTGTGIHRHGDARTRGCTDAGTQTWVCTYPHPHACSHVACIYVYMLTNMNVCTHARAHRLVHMHTWVHTQTHSCLCTPTPPHLLSDAHTSARCATGTHAHTQS